MSGRRGDPLERVLVVLRDGVVERNPLERDARRDGSVSGRWSADRFRSSETPPSCELVTPARDELAERLRHPDRARYLGHVEEEDLVRRSERAIRHEPFTKRETEAPNMGLRDAVDPVVVLLGERPGAHRRGDDLLDAS